MTTGTGKDHNKQTHKLPAKQFASLTIVDHPLAAHKLTLLRDKDTPQYLFRQLIKELSLILYCHATANLSLKERNINTPITQAKCHSLQHSNPTIIPILRAGLGMLDAFITMIPTARIGHIGLARNENTLESECYYFKVPVSISQAPVFICDPMLATGGSALAAIKMLRKKGVKDITLVCIIAAPEGVERVYTNHPDVPIFIAHLDKRLNEHAYIVPGLGDAGDRECGTIAQRG